MIREFFFLLLISICFNGFSQNGKMIDEIRSQKSGTSVWWAGQDSWIIKSGDLVIATDLFLENNGPIAPAAVKTESTGQDTLRYIYVGAESCAGKCHNNEELGYQYDKWKSSRHSKSYESLTTEKALSYSKNAGITENPWESLTCLKCHVTATGLDASFIGATYKKEDGVTCESCHKGEFIPKTFLPKEADCLKCHNNSIHEVSEFDFNERCQKISHPRPKTKQE